MAAQVTVPVKPAVESTINWTQIAAFGASAAAWFGLNVTPETLAAIILGVQAVQTLVTVVLKTFFTKSVTPASAAKL